MGFIDLVSLDHGESESEECQAGILERFSEMTGFYGNRIYPFGCK